MKLSLMWLREHIDCPQGHDTWLNNSEEIVRRLARSTAEIERAEPISISVDRLFLGLSKNLAGNEVTLTIPELSCDITMPSRSDVILNQWYMVYRDQSNTYRYGTLADITYKTDGENSRLLPPFFISDSETRGAWKQRCERRDVLITVDNKSINHRPDLWSHYGFAREIAVLMGWKLKPPVELPFVSVVPAAREFVEVTSPTCERFARLDFYSTTKGSFPWMALRLARLDHKPISAIVDTTNYVMFDKGQPLHAFDSSMVKGALTVRQAVKGEKLTLLDGTNILLEREDCVVADEVDVLSLAGIKGGAGSGITQHTTHITLEAAYFLPTAIRRSSKAHHIRTESSTRFEKGLDKALVTQSVLTFLSILLKEKAIEQQPYELMVWQGPLEHMTPPIELYSEYLTRKIGIEIPEKEIITTLSNLGFSVHPQGNNAQRWYQVVVPSFRKSDVNIPEDIIEEIARMRGYDSLPGELPARSMQLMNNKRVQTLRSIRHHVAYGLRMQEVMSYPFFDEDFLHKAQVTIEGSASVRNPVSEQWRRLVTSLIPNLVAQVMINLPEEKEVRLFEMAAIWQPEGTIVHEKHKITWIWYKQKDLDFYEGKQMVVSLLDMLHVSSSWHVASKDIPVWWYAPHTAVLHHGQREIGHAGMLNPMMLRNVLHGECFAVELDLDFLQDYIPACSLYQPVSKYPTIATDISMLLPYTTTVSQVLGEISSVHSAIIRTFLIDFFEKKSWGDRRSITIRIICGDQARTMTHEEVNVIIEKVSTLLKETFKAEIR